VYLDVQLPVRPFGATTEAYGSVVSTHVQCQLIIVVVIIFVIIIIIIIIMLI